MLTLGLGIAGCGQQPAITEIALDANKPVSSVIGKPETGLQANSLGAPANGNWGGTWNVITHARTLINGRVLIQNTVEPDPQLALTKIKSRWMFKRNGEVLIRTGESTSSVTGSPIITYTTAYLVRVPGSNDHFEGWNAKYKPSTNTGSIAYIEMKRNGYNTTTVDGEWTSRWDPKLSVPLSVCACPLENTTTLSTPYGVHPGSQIAYSPQDGDLVRSGTFASGNTIARAGGYMIRVPNTNTYLGWYSNSDVQTFNMFVATQPVAGQTNWDMRYVWEPPQANEKTGGQWNLDANGVQSETNLRYTTDPSGREMFRTGTYGAGTASAAHLVKSFKTSQAQSLNGIATLL
jgi:hypothetical protein